MKLIRVLLCAITLFMTMGVAHAQKIMGLVVEKNAKGVEEPLAGANVVWLGTTQGTSTEANGVFMIDPLEGATHLVISYVGYKSDTIKFDPQIRIKVILIPDELLD